MKPEQTKAIILSRTDYGEADRIITLISPDNGKLRLIAKGARKIKSKLSGGIELFSTSDITYITGRGEIGTLISSRLIKHFTHIVEDIDRVQLGYGLIKLLNKTTEDHLDPSYFSLLEKLFEALDDSLVPIELVNLWFQAQILKNSGHSPNLTNDINQERLQAGRSYNFNFDQMAFKVDSSGQLKDRHIKTLRLIFSNHEPKQLSKVADLEGSLRQVEGILVYMTRTYT